MAHNQQTGVGITVGMTALAGVLAGTLLGLALGRRAGRDADAAMTESVEVLKRRAHRVLGDLSASVADLSLRHAPSEQIL